MSARTTITGNVVADPIQRTTASGRPVCNFTVVENRRKRGADGSWEDDEPLFMAVTCWNGLAVNVAASVHKGDRLTVEGRLSPVSWTDDAGQTRRSLEVVADEVSVSLTFASVPSIVRNQRRDAASVPA